MPAWFAETKLPVARATAAVLSFGAVVVLLFASGVGVGAAAVGCVTTGAGGGGFCGCCCCPQLIKNKTATSPTAPTLRRLPSRRQRCLLWLVCSMRFNPP